MYQARDDRSHPLHCIADQVTLDARHTQLCIFLNCLLLSNLEALGLGGSEIILVVVGHGAVCLSRGIDA